MVRKQKLGKPPSFSEVFKKFFGDDHAVTQSANKFEEFIKGYFGWVNPDDMDSARDEFQEIKKTILDALNGGARATG